MGKEAAGGSRMERVRNPGLGRQHLLGHEFSGRSRRVAEVGGLFATKCLALNESNLQILPSTSAAKHSNSKFLAENKSNGSSNCKFWDAGQIGSACHGCEKGKYPVTSSVCGWTFWQLGMKLLPRCSSMVWRGRTKRIQAVIC